MRAVMSLLILAGCETGDLDALKADTDVIETDPVATDDTDLLFPPYPQDDTLRLNHAQAKGTHNSYHLEPPFPLDGSHRYTQPPLDEQLALHGVRQLEIDLHYRTDVGFEVFHIPVIDDVSSCRMFTDCLSLVRTWSDANPGHFPIMIWLEPKDDVSAFVPGFETFDDRYDEVEADILSVFDRSRILEPDEVRGTYATLPAALAAQGWPTLGELRGKIILSLLDSGSHRDAYLGDADNLAGRLFFVDADDADDPFAATFKINDARRDAALVSERVAGGFLVTSNVDGASNDDPDNADKLAASLASGTHFLSSDFPGPVDGRDYQADIPGGQPVRCNPVAAPEDCTSAALEDLQP